MWSYAVNALTRSIKQQQCSMGSRHITGMHRVQDTWVEGEGYSCLKKCECPADGSACALGAACDPQHFVCKAGYQRFSDGQAKCFRPGCAEGSLLEAVGRSVSNGRAYAVCTCTGGVLLTRSAQVLMWCALGC